MEGWRRDMYFDATGTPVVCCRRRTSRRSTRRLSIPARCCSKGTNVSEGRGTTRPFELIGAPWVDAERFADAMNALAAARRALPSGRLRADVSEARADQLRRLPDSRARSRGLPAGRDRRRAASPRSAPRIPIASAGAIRLTSTSTRQLPIDILAGSSELREQIEAGAAGTRHRALVGARTTAFRQICGSAFFSTDSVYKTRSPRGAIV